MWILVEVLQEGLKYGGGLSGGADILAGNRGGGLEGGADSVCGPASVAASSSSLLEPGPHASVMGRHCSPNNAA